MGAVEGFTGSMLQATSFVDRVLYYREGFRRGCLHGGVDLYEMLAVFPLSQAIYGACLLFAYWFYFLACHVSNLRCILPFRLQEWMEFDRKLWRTCMMFTGQSLKELVVQKGQELVPFRSSYLDDYGVVDRLGSLVVRLIFRPFEESNRLKFAEMASGFFIITFGPGYSYTLLRMAYKEKHCDDTTRLLLILYWFYVISLAFNGTLEAFLQSVANETQLKMLNDFALFCSLVYVLIKVFLIAYAGAIGLIVLDAINMLLRILYFMAFIRRFFQNSYTISLHQVLPSGWWVLLFSGAATIISDTMVLNKENEKTYWQTLPWHLGVGASCFFLSCAVIYTREKALIGKFIEVHRQHTD